jgi:GalNAc-alpha-(1->4)-GalNAc-alpha-(1->3)-diNAcBac-PP-undecaprenol alpha-1,4-N-acetyl-D-galactosaminyltransferase
LKIVFVSQPLSTGGAERVVAVLANRFYELGHEVKIIVIDNGDINIYPTYKDIEFIHICKPFNPIIDLFHRVRKMRAYFNDYNPDIIISFTTQKNVSTLLATLFTKHRVIISERNNPYIDPKSITLRLLRKLFYFTADGYVFQTEGAKEFFSIRIQKRSCIIPNPISDNIATPWIGNRSKRIVMVNRLDVQKNLKMAIDAFKIISERYTDYILEIYGKGPLYNELKRYIAIKGLENKVFLMCFL